MGPLLPVLLVGGGIAWMLAWANQAGQVRVPRDQEPILRDPLNPTTPPIALPPPLPEAPILPPRLPDPRLPGRGEVLPGDLSGSDLQVGDEIVIETTDAILNGQPLLYNTAEPLLVSLPWAGGIVRSIMPGLANVDLAYVFPDLPLPGDVGNDVIPILGRTILVPSSVIFLRRRAPDPVFQPPLRMTRFNPPAMPGMPGGLVPRTNPDNPNVVAGWDRRRVWRRA